VGWQVCTADCKFESRREKLHRSRFMMVCNGTTQECMLSQTKMAVPPFALSPARRSYWHDV
jgi:hypothetical protein